MSVYLADTLLKLGSRIPLNLAERTVLLAVCFRADEAGECGFSQADIAAQIGMLPPAITRVFRRLKAMRLIERRIPNGISVNIVTLEGFLPATSGSGYEDKREELEAKTVNSRLTQINAGLTQTPDTPINSGLTKRERKVNSSEKGQINAGLTQNEPRVNPIYKTDIYTPLTPQGEESESERANFQVDEKTHANADQGLAAFMKLYPKVGGGRWMLGKLWEEAMQSVSYGEMVAALNVAKETKQWQEEFGRYIPTLAKWLETRQWERFGIGGGHPDMTAAVKKFTEGLD